MNQVFLNPIIVAIDKNSETEAYELSKELRGHIGAVKLGLEYFNTYGPEGIIKIKNLDIPIFLDLKIHDIPQTVKKTIDTLSSLRPAILNVHALGGKKMMEYALKAISQSSPETHLIAVTILTSLDNDDLSMMGVDISTKNLVSNLAKLTKESGLSGVVCSSEEIKIVRKSCGKILKLLFQELDPRALAIMIKNE